MTLENFLNEIVQEEGTGRQFEHFLKDLLVFCQPATLSLEMERADTFCVSIVSHYQALFNGRSGSVLGSSIDRLRIAEMATGVAVLLNQHFATFTYKYK